MVTFGNVVREDNATVDGKVVSAKASSSGPKSARKTSLRYSDSTTTTGAATTAATTLPTTSITKSATAGQAGATIRTTAAGDRTAPKPAVNVRARGPRFGLAQWQRLVRSSKDLAQRKGQPFRKDIPWTEIKQHNQPHDGWMVLRGVVYNIGPYLAYHPGGEEILHKVLGKDGTKLFDKYHPWVSIEGLIGTLAIGTLATKTTTPEETTPDETDPDDDDDDDESSQ